MHIDRFHWYRYVTNMDMVMCECFYSTYKFLWNVHKELISVIWIFSLFQNVPVGTFVTHVSAEDTDDGTNGVVEYEFVENIAGSQDFRKFTIDRKTGNITTARTIDREEKETYLVSRQHKLCKFMYGGVNLELQS